MKIENVYKCLRCGKLETVPAPDKFRMIKGGQIEASVIIEDESAIHRCDLTNDKQIGILQKVGFNVIES